MPLDQEVIDELKELQKLLNLCDTDIRPTILSTLKATPVTSTDTAQVIKALLPEKSEKADPAIAYTPAADSPVPLAAPQCEVSLESEKGVDYSYLKKLLELHQWREADRETASVMLLAAGRTQAGWLDKESIEKFPRQDLHTIDQLWLRYSCGRFGFSVQKEIWLEVGDKVDYETEKKLGDRLGWRVNEKWIRHGEVVFDLSAPRGHLPLLGIWGLGILGVWWGWCVWGGWVSALASGFIKFLTSFLTMTSRSVNIEPVD
ncbi:MAG: GUN4 domain-containing protein [Leptolyngbyaceae cyanobacterium SL_1_1]|nr:GUN4 domain-containing protein [Leptolyngbyaceae cyanobacterium SL_1_1]